jgi:ATP phosphoribosyltransferase
VNGLKEVTTIFESQVVLVANPDAYEIEEVRQYASFLGQLLTGVIEAREKRYITMNVPAACVEAVKAALPALKSPTVQPLSEEGYVAVSSVVPTAGLAELKLKLLRLGASGIVELDAYSIM